MATLNPTSKKQLDTALQPLPKAKHEPLSTIVRLSKSEYESLMSEMREAARQIRKMLQAS